MKRSPFVLKLKPNKKSCGISAIKSIWADIKSMLDEKGVRNFSVWGIEDFLFCYGEYPDSGITVSPAEKDMLESALSPYMDMFAAPGTLPLMYHDIGVVREDKSLIRHRVFSTKLKDGCADEYKRRHDVLVEQRGDTVSDGPETNFTIWNANGYIFGYCELVRSYDHEMTEEERASKIEWETRQLEIMDWLTDDVDWMTGEKHDAIELIAQQ
ncbi:MAG: L-rhamnose mutarotase [Clostridia bacterium]|nr:L-rhamnose mutarotase [Clostridia bacterium]